MGSLVGPPVGPAGTHRVEIPAADTTTQTVEVKVVVGVMVAVDPTLHRGGVHLTGQVACQVEVLEEEGVQVVMVG